MGRTIRSRLTRYPGLVALALLSSAWISSPDGESLAHAGPTVQNIIDAWRARQASVHTFKFEWSDSRTTAAYTNMGRPGTSAKGELFPATDTTHRVSVALSIDGGMLRYSTRGPKWSADQEQFLPIWYLNVFDGAVSKAFFGYAAGEDDRFFPRGFVHEKEKRIVDSGNPYLVPLLVTYRPFHPDMGKLDLAGYGISAKQGTIGGRNCVILEPPAASVWSESYWIDCQHGFVVLRVVRAVKKSPVMQFDISYIEDPLHGWVPSAWKYAARQQGSGRLLRQSLAKVTKYEINYAIPRSQFQFEFPPATRVTDRNTGEYYIVREGGNKRLITMDEVRGRATYEEMVATESGKALSGRQRRLRSWPVYVSGGIAGLLVAILVYRRFRRTVA